MTFSVFFHPIIYRSKNCKTHGSINIMSGVVVTLIAWLSSFTRVSDLSTVIISSLSVGWITLPLGFRSNIIVCRLGLVYFKYWVSNKKTAHCFVWFKTDIMLSFPGPQNGSVLFCIKSTQKRSKNSWVCVCGPLVLCCIHLLSLITSRCVLLQSLSVCVFPVVPVVSSESMCFERWVFLLFRMEN